MLPLPSPGNPVRAQPHPVLGRGGSGPGERSATEDGLYASTASNCIEVTQVTSFKRNVEVKRLISIKTESYLKTAN